MKVQLEKQADSGKAPYVSPELKVYGTVSELTHSGAATVGDAFGGSQTTFDSVPPAQ